MTPKPGFRFKGSIGASKSMVNRALIVQSFFPTLKIQGSSTCDDVIHMKKALVNFLRGQEINCGEAGTVMRFMALRVSREKGVFHLKGSKRLLQRPQQELAFILNQLSVNIDFLDDRLIVRSEGWKRPLTAVRIPRERSSQFASGLLLSAWNLPFALEIEFAGAGVSEGYWQMTLQMLQALGMDVEIERDILRVSANQQCLIPEVVMEPDYSSMFAIVAAALVNGEIEIQGVGANSLQPDYIFLDFLKKMGAPVTLQNGVLRAQKAAALKAIEVSVRDCPDLVPVLATLCAFAEGTSKLVKAPQLIHKESDRLGKTRELLALAGVESVVSGDGIHVHGEGVKLEPRPFNFDPDQDHRMAMAAALLRLRSDQVGIQNIDVVNKSFPEFWKILGMV